MKKLVTSFLALLLGVVVTQSYAQTYTLNIVKWSGTGTGIELSSIDKITFTDNDLVMKYYAGNSESIDMLSIRKITFTNNPSGTENIIGIGNTISISLISPNTLRLNNLLEGKHKVEIYSTTGNLVQNTVVNSDAPVLIMNQLNKGVYIIRVNNQSLKIVRP